MTPTIQSPSDCDSPRMTDTTIYYVNEPDAMHPCIGWYYETPAGYYKGPFQTDTEAAIEAAKEIEL